MNAAMSLFLSNLFHGILNVEGPEIQASVSAHRNFKNVDVDVLITYLSIPRGIIYSEGQSVIMTKDVETATSTALGLIRSTDTGNMGYCGSLFFRTRCKNKT